MMHLTITSICNLISAVVINTPGSDVDTVVIDGNIVVQNKKILTLDEDAILDDVQQRCLSVAKRAGIKTEDFLTIWPVRKIYVCR